MTHDQHPQPRPFTRLGRSLNRMLASQSERIYSLLRMLSGAMFSFHGMQKIFGLLSEKSPDLFSQLWLGGVIELLTGSLLVFGLFTRPAAFLASGTMTVAYCQFHWQFQFDAHFFPAINHGELALLYSVLLLFLAAQGGGLWSLDSRRQPQPST